MEWISVDDERQPEKYEVAFVTDGKLVGVASCRTRFDVLDFIRSCNPMDNRYLGKITHWMPAPAPPAE